MYMYMYPNRKRKTLSKHGFLRPILHYLHVKLPVGKIANFIKNVSFIAEEINRHASNQRLYNRLHRFVDMAK